MTRTGPEVSTTGLPGRRPELDAIRLFVVVGLVFFHSALVFDSRDDYYVKNAETTDVTMIIAGFGVVWAMPALFLIAGLGAWYSLSRRGPGGFALERLRRLGVPLVFAGLVLIPLPQWIRARSEGSEVSYLDFLPAYFDVHLDWPDFPFVLDGEYFETGHLWFVVLLLVFSLVLAALVRWAPREGSGWVERMVGALTRRRGAVLLLAAPLALIAALLGMEENFAGWHRWAYLVLFGYGYLLAGDDRLRVAMRRDAGLAAVIGLTLFFLTLPGLLGTDEPFTEMSPLAISARLAFGSAGWCWLVAILGLLDRRAQRAAAVRPPTSLSDDDEMRRGRRRRLYAYLGEAALPIYILHQPIVVAVAYGVVGWEAPIIVEYLVVSLTSLVLTVAAYDLLVRRTAVTRFLFGMRPQVTAA